MVGRVTLVILLTWLAFPAVAESAGTLSRDGNTVVFTEPADSTVVNNVHVYFFDDAHWIRDDTGGAITDAGSGCQLLVAAYRCTNVDAVRIVTTGGNDTVDGRETEVGTEPSKLPLFADLGIGSDSFEGGSAGDLAFGGLGEGEDNFDGNAGDDVLDGGPGQDDHEGGDGADTVTYAGRGEAVTVDLGNPGFKQGSDLDGPSGLRDLIEPDVEVIVGGNGADVMKGGGYPITFRGGPGGDQLSGSDGVETLDGGDGDDLLNALGGPDTVLGGRGVDTVEARDGDVDTVDCGPEVDNAAADPFDALTSCDPTEPAPIRETVVLPSRVLFDLAYTFSANRRGAVLRNLTAEVERGARLTASCRTRRGRRCRRTRDLTRAGAAVAVRLRGFEGRRLPVGARLTIRVTKPDTIGAVKTLTIRRRRAPSVRTLCLPPGAARPAAC